MNQYQNIGLVTNTTLINENIKLLEKCKEYGQIVLEKCNKLREKCWKSVIFCPSIVEFTYFFGKRLHDDVLHISKKPLRGELSGFLSIYQAEASCISPKVY